FRSLVRNRLRNHHNAVDVAEYSVPRADAHTGADDGTIHLDHAATALAVERSDAAVEHRKLHLTDMAHVPHQSVGHAPRSAARLCRRGQQLAPRRDAIGW